MDITDIHDRIFVLARSAIGVDVHTYLNETRKSLYGLLIADGGASFRPMFGDPPAVLLDAANARPSDTVAGFCVDVGEALRINIRADVFLLSEAMLYETGYQLDAIIVHELAHFAIDSANDDILRSELTTEDRQTAAELYARTDRQMERVTRHNEYFCQVLIVACRRWIADRNDLNIQDALYLAMKFDVDGGFRQ